MLKSGIRTFLLAVGLLLAASRLSAQYDPSFTHYWMMETAFNPAAAGSTDCGRVVGAYSAQMSGYDEAPNTMFFSADLPAFFANPRHGVGASVLNDEIGLFSHKRFSVQYSFGMKLWGGQLRLGAQGDMVDESFDGGKLDLEESNDPAFASSQQNGSKLDAGFGLRYSRGQWYAGLSAQHLTAPTVLLGETNELHIERMYYFTAGYNIPLRNPFFKIKPSVFGMFDGHEYKAALSGRLEYENERKMLFAGASYSPETSVALFVGGKFHGVVLSYSYEAYTSGIGVDHGAHEIVLSYEWPLDLGKKGKNLHKSVRWL